MQGFGTPAVFKVIIFSILYNWYKGNLSISLTRSLHCSAVISTINIQWPGGHRGVRLRIKGKLWSPQQSSERLKCLVLLWSSLLADWHLRLKDQHVIIINRWNGPRCTIGKIFRICNKPYVLSLFIKQLWKSVAPNLYPCYAPCLEHGEGWIGLTTPVLHHQPTLFLCNIDELQVRQCRSMA